MNEYLYFSMTAAESNCIKILRISDKLTTSDVVLAVVFLSFAALLIYYAALDYGNVHC